MSVVCYWHIVEASGAFAWHRFCSHPPRGRRSVVANDIHRAGCMAEQNDPRSNWSGLRERASKVSRSINYRKHSQRHFVSVSRVRYIVIAVCRLRNSRLRHLRRFCRGHSGRRGCFKNTKNGNRACKRREDCLQRVAVEKKS